MPPTYQSCKRFRNQNQIPELESESKPGLLESEMQSESIFSGKHWNLNQNRNHYLLESEAWILVNPEIGIQVESALVESELESES